MSTPLQRFLSLFTSTALLLFAACGGGGGGGGTTGNATIALTDAVNDDLETFEVDVSDITLTRLNGSTVSVMSRATRVDFADLESLSELFVGASLPAGIYTGAAMTLDFGNAVVTLKGKTTPAAVLDGNGVAITGSVPVQIDFGTAARPQIVVNRHHIYELDLDLDSAVDVDLTNNQVTFTPVMAVRADPTNPKPAGINGVLAAVNVANASFEVEKRAVDGTPICTFTVATDTTTAFQVDGSVFHGATGIAALALKPVGTTHVFAQGTHGANSRSMTAVAVEAGAGTPGNGQSWIVGHIVGRDNGAGQDATLTVLGHSLDIGSSTRRFNTLHTVQVALAATRVLRRGAGNSLTSDALDIGQRIAAFGEMTGTNLDARGLGTAPDVIRMLLTSVFGTATGAASGNVLTLDVARFDRRLVSNFNFTVGGNAEADPANYTVDVTGLSTAGILATSRVRCIGWVNPVGVAGDDNFQALSLVDRSTDGKAMLCFWSPASTSALPTISSTQLTLDVSAAAVKVVSDGFTTVTIANTPAPTLVPLAGLGVYMIVQGGSLELDFGFANFAASLQTRLGAGAAVRRISGLGRYGAVPQVFSALVATVVLQ
jgi:hypothetical protein